MQAWTSPRCRSRWSMRAAVSPCTPTLIRSRCDREPKSRRACTRPISKSGTVVLGSPAMSAVTAASADPRSRSLSRGAGAQAGCDGGLQAARSVAQKRALAVRLRRASAAAERASRPAGRDTGHDRGDPLGRQFGHDRLRAAVNRAVAQGACELGAVRYLLGASELQRAPPAAIEVGSLHRYERRPPTMAGYDRLLTAGRRCDELAGQHLGGPARSGHSSELPHAQDADGGRAVQAPGRGGSARRSQPCSLPRRPARRRDRRARAQRRAAAGQGGPAATNEDLAGVRLRQSRRHRRRGSPISRPAATSPVPSRSC